MNDSEQRDRAAGSTPDLKMVTGYPDGYANIDVEVVAEEGGLQLDNGCFIPWEWIDRVRPLFLRPRPVIPAHEVARIQSEHADTLAGTCERSGLSAVDILQTVGFLRMEQECPMIREELVQTSSGRRRLALLDQWKSLGCPPPAFRLANLPSEEVTLKLEAFLDSLG
jgi:hypothetical protein